jgi:hypothetical protein
LSATDLVRLDLWNIPHSGYTSPEAIVTGLAALPNLKSLDIEFESPRSRPDRGRRDPLPSRTVLPALTRFVFVGISEYLEDLVARIDAPLLDCIWITFIHKLIFDIPQLARFMRRTTRFRPLNEAHVVFQYCDVLVKSLSPKRDYEEKFALRISCKERGFQLPSLTEVFASLFPSIYTVERLYIYGSRNMPSQWQEDIKNMQLLDILRPFTAVKDLYLSEKFAQCLASALQDLVEERVTDELPTLESLSLEGLPPSGSDQECIEWFVAARQLLDHPVHVSKWKGALELEPFF